VHACELLGRVSCTAAECRSLRSYDLLTRTAEESPYNMAPHLLRLQVRALLADSLARCTNCE
jgi:hypothetical protein